jgi:hypothetical protein
MMLNSAPMVRDFFDPTPEQQIVVLVDTATLRKAEKLIESCEPCNDDADIHFDWILDCVTGSDASVAEFGPQCTYASEGIKDITL